MKIKDIRATVKCIEFYKNLIIDIEKVVINFAEVTEGEYTGTLPAIKVGKEWYIIDYTKKEVLIDSDWLSYIEFFACKE